MLLTLTKCGPNMCPSTDLDQAELALFVGRVFNESNGVASKVKMDLRGIKLLGAYRSRVDGPNG